jgi:hypothetical protein
MAIKINLLVVFVFWFLLGPLNVVAQSHAHQDHQHHQTGIISPFDGNDEVGSLHCLLRGHANRFVCPHSQSNVDQTPNIAKECDGKRSGSIPIMTLFVGEFALMNFILLTDYSFESKLFQIEFTSFDSFIDCLDPPPIVFL